MYNCTIVRVTLVSPQVWNQTEPEPAADHLLRLCSLKNAGVWAPPMYLWVLGPIYLFYIHRHGKGYLRMSPRFKAKMVATASRSLEPTRQWVWGGAGSRLEPGGDPPQNGHSSYQGAHRVGIIKQSDTPETTQVNAAEQGSSKQIW